MPLIYQQYNFVINGSKDKLKTDIVRVIKGAIFGGMGEAAQDVFR